MEIAVLGAGPAGLTAAWELLERGKADPPRITVIEETDEVGGIAVTKRYKDYRFDIGGHRFFTKNAAIRSLWKDVLKQDFITCSRLSRIFYKDKLFHYPLKPMDMLSTLTLSECFTFGLSYAAARLLPRPARSFEDWVRNQFGRRLYETFFKSYTEKVWGMPCDRISADWAAQRIKGVSLFSAIRSAFRKSGGQVKSLIESFEYPVLGPGMLWERMRDILKGRGVRFLMERKAVKLFHDGKDIKAVRLASRSGREENVEADSFLSSIPLRELVHSLEPAADRGAAEAAERLTYRDFLIVALVLDREQVFPDNWIYVQVPDVAVGRIQNFKNWSRAMVPDQGKTCLGMEFFCFEGDRLWNSTDSELIELASAELCRLGFARRQQILEGVPVRMKKAYPVYTLDYREQVGRIRRYLARFRNLQVMGRNGLHRYNNQDHSMMTAMLAARNVYGGSFDVFKVNEDASYHEERGR
ncbi:MAG: NAD(P)/FAD-dependent oxidoreductase [Deltaproteobacteria bacterium]